MMPRMMSRSGPSMLARMVVMSDVLSGRRAPAVQHWVGSAGGACAPPLAGAFPGAAVDAGADAGAVEGVLAAGAVAFGGAATALKFVPSTMLTSASTTDLSSTSLPTPPR